MRRLLSPLRKTLASLVLAVGLGCAGTMNAAMQGLGVDVEMHMGADAVHPPDFPAMPLTVGEKAMSIRVTAPGDSVNLPDNIPLPDDMNLDPGQKYDIEVIVYTVPPAELDTACASAQNQAMSSGFELLKPQEGEPEPTIKIMSMFQRKNQLFGVVGTEEDGEASVVLIRISPAAPDPAEAGEAPAAVPEAEEAEEPSE